MRFLICAVFALLCAPVFANERLAEEDMTIWIDVRTPEEYAQGHIAGSINIPFEMIGSEISSLTRNVDDDIRVYCRSGRRSGVAMDTLKGMGYANVINEGGYEDLLGRKANGENIP
jgi:phage shock protein E